MAPRRWNAEITKVDQYKELALLKLAKIEADSAKDDKASTEIEAKISTASTAIEAKP